MPREQKSDFQTCQRCEKVFASDRGQCPSCKAWQVPTNVYALNGREDDTVLLNSVPDSDVERLVSGPWDECFGGKDGKFGIARTSTILLGGEPGGGKSTLSLQILDGIAKSTKREVLLVGAEESAKEIMARSSRLNLTNRGMLRLLPMGTNSDLATVMQRWKPAAIVMDSLPGFVNDPAEAVELAATLKGYAVLLNCPIILIDHINKQDDFAGFQALKHTVDTTMQLSTDDSDLRTLFTIKNRYGKGHVEIFMEMTEQGLVVIEDIEEYDNEDEDE